MPTFTDRYLKSLTATGKNHRIYEGGSDRGFCIQVTAAGSITFEQQYTIKGVRRWLRLGRYPDTPLAAARLRAREARGLIDQGIDPKRGDPKAQHAHGTVAQLLDAYVSHLEARDKRTIANIRRSIEANFIAKHGDRPAREIQPLDIRETLYRVIKRGAPTHANRLRSHLHAMFKFGINHDNDPKSLGSAVLFGIDTNPVMNVPRDHTAERVGNRVLSWDEIRQIWDAPEMSVPVKLALRLILITGGQRVRMVTGAPWDEFDLAGQLWLVPGSRMKARLDHLVPLTAMALTCLDDLRCIYPDSRWLFPAKHQVTATKPQDLCTLPHMVQEYCAAVGMEPWVPKDLRRTAKTRMGEIGISKDIRDRIQGHAMQDVSAKHYDRWTYAPERRAALETWEKHLVELIVGEDRDAQTTD